MHLRGLFFSQTNPKTRLNYCYGTWHSLLSLAFPSLQCVVCLFSSVVWTKFLWYFASFLSKEVIICSGVPFLTSPKFIFFACAGLARSLREKCNLISQFWSCWIDIFWNAAAPWKQTAYSKKSFDDKVYLHTMYESRKYNIYIYVYVYDIFHDSTWKHLRQPCANLAPRLCFAGFPCVTPHTELVKSYKCVGCVPRRLKFLFRTFDRLPCVSRLLSFLFGV